MAENAYYTLLTSLPHIDSLFDSKVTPLSRLQLDRRLSMLSREDMETLVKVEQIMQWSHLDHDVKEEALIKLASQLVNGFNSPCLRELINWRLDMRSVVAALRRITRGEQAPSISRWSYGTRYAYIRRNWSSPTLGLQSTFPWITDAVACFEKKEHYKLEKILLGTIWSKLNELGANHRFDFEAVIIYVLRWSLVARWTTYEGKRAVTRFRELTELALGEFSAQLPGEKAY
ncbi:MAG: DUF2764 family protein [Endozoicomonas sp. (ex Botrylloides leachii)]|nr:DUF2764 family protein [Endozoicomonas sp. (ex Botrylloides leachii)]